MGLLVAALVVVILFGTFVLVRQTNALAAKTRALARTNARFDAALSNMPHGLSMFDGMLVSIRYREMYELTEDQVMPGTPLSRILRDYKTLISASTHFFAKRSTIFRSNTVRCQAGSHEDITEKRRAHAAGRRRILQQFDVAIDRGPLLFDESSGW